MVNQPENNIIDQSIKGSCSSSIALLQGGALVDNLILFGAGVNNSCSRSLLSINNHAEEVSRKRNQGVCR